MRQTKPKKKAPEEQPIVFTSDEVTFHIRGAVEQRGSHRKLVFRNILKKSKRPAR